MQQPKKVGKLNACWNNAYRKVFGMHVWDSVKEIQFLCERLDFRYICLLKKFLFLHRLLHRLNNGVVKQCFISYSQSVEFVPMCYDFDVMIVLCFNLVLLCCLICMFLGGSCKRLL